MARDLETCPQSVVDFYERARTKRLRRDKLLESKSQQILDVGCATGTFLRTLQIQGFTHLAGLEISSEQADYAREQFGIKVFKDFSEVPDSSVDLVTMYAVLEHFSDPVAVMSEVVRVLKKDGRVVIDVPNMASLYRWMTGRSWLWLIPPAHLQYFSPRSLKRLLNDCGLRICNARSLSSTTYLFILAYHLASLTGRSMPRRSLSSGGRRITIRVLEFSLRVMLSPLEPILRLLKIHNRLAFTAIKS